MDDQSTHSARYLAWLVVVTVHTGLFWLLTLQPRDEPSTADEHRLRLVWIRPAPEPPSSTPVPPAPAAAQPLQVVRVPPRPQPAATPVEPVPHPAALAAPVAESSTDLLEQGQAWAREQAPPGSDFAQDPMRSRRAQLPGGDRGDAFRMRKPMTPARVMQAVAGLFGDPGPPCPRVKANVQGLLTATSDRERALLEEELRRERQLCPP